MRAPVRDLDLGEVFREVVRLYRAHWRLLTLVAVAVLLPQALLDAAFGEIKVERLDSLADVSRLLSIPLAVVINLGGEAFYSGVVAAVVLHWRAGVGRPHMREVAAGIPYLTLIAIDLVVSVGIALGLALLVVPGILFAVYTFTAPALAEVRGLGVRAALREGRELVKGNFRRVLAATLVAYLGTELAVQALVLPFHGFGIEAVAHLAAEALVEPFQGATAVIVALALLDIHGRETVPVRGGAGTG
ncbi:MAG: hypothetical protein ACXWYV_08960 [Solirubrobacterales bacterium]